jgi:hypothetical protein
MSSKISASEVNVLLTRLGKFYENGMRNIGLTNEQIEAVKTEVTVQQLNDIFTIACGGTLDDLPK